MTTPPFNRKAAQTVDAWVDSSNKLDAIAEATALPRPAQGAETNPQLPHGSAVSWALWSARKYKLTTDETLVLVALAQHAAAALWSGDGYSYTTAADIVALLDTGTTAWNPRLVKTLLSPKGNIWPLVEDRTLPTGIGDNIEVVGWRIPNEALDGNWLDRAARQTHYVKATDHVRR